MIRRLAAMVAVLVTPAAMAQSPAQEREAVLAVTEALFEAVASRDPEDWRAVLAEDGVSTVLMEDAEDETAAPRIIPNAELIAAMQPVDASHHERWTSPPEVTIAGDTAAVWGPYDFWVDGNFSHCGVNMIDLEKRDGRWIAVNLSWTQITENCPTAEGPPPQAG
jgi:ketosteroid isomerase-like protein